MKPAGKPPVAPPPTPPTAREIDRLMAGPPKRLPSIVVVGDEAVFGITPPRKRDC